MNTTTYLQQFKINLLYGVKTGAVPTLLLNILCALFLATGLSEAMWDITFIDGMYISLLTIAHLILIVFLGIISISAIISSTRKFSNNAAFILGALIGAILVTIGDYISVLLWQSYEFLFLPSIITILLLAYVGQKMNRRANLDSETKSTELRAIIGMALIAFIGSIAFVLMHEDYRDILNEYIYLGYALSVSLPIAILAGFLLDILIKKVLHPILSSWTIWQRVDNAVRWMAAGIKNRMGSHPIPKIITFLLLAFGVFSGILYLKLMIPSSRELWRIKDNNLEDPTVVNNLVLFKATKGEYLHSWCEYIYAVDKNTGKPVWSSEKFTTQYCDQSSGPVYTAIILLTKDGSVCFVSSSYWITDDDQGYVLYAINNSNGKLLWKVDGYAGYPYNGSALLDYTNIDTNYIYVASKDGSFLAIDSSSGKPLWKQQIPKVDYTEDIIIEYHDQIVYYYYSGNDSITVFDARDGNRLWEKSNLNYVRYFIISDDLIYLPAYSYTDLATTGGSIGSPYYLTALDRRTGKQIWELSFGQHFFPSVDIIGNKVYVLTSHSEGQFDDYKSLRSLMVVNKSTGELIWQFNEDYSHGDMNYLVQDNVVYVGTKDNYLFALNNETGKVIWQVKDTGFPYYFHGESGTLVVVYEDKYVSGLDMETGKQKWIRDIGMVSEYPDEFMIPGDGALYISSVANRRVYAIDVETGRELWSWNHWHPRDRAYHLKALDNNVLYVDQYRRFFGYDWFFALKTKP